MSYRSILISLERTEKRMDSLSHQVDGNHYKNLKIQPMEYSYANKLDWYQGEIVKYITRFRAKGGKKDLEKIIHLCQVLIQLEYSKLNTAKVEPSLLPRRTPTAEAVEESSPWSAHFPSSFSSSLLPGEPVDSLGTPIREPSACR